CIDEDGRAAGARRYAGEAVTLDADGLGDGERSVAGGIEHIDLAARGHGVVRLLEGAAGRGESAGVAIAALRSDEHPGRLRLCRRDVERDRESGRQQCHDKSGPSHGWKPPSWSRPPFSGEYRMGTISMGGKNRAARSRRRVLTRAPIVSRSAVER